MKRAEPPIFVNASKLSQKIRICSSAMSESSSTRRLTLKKESPTEPVTKRSASPGPSNASDVKRQNDKIHSPLKVPPAKETENVSSAELLAVLHEYGSKMLTKQDGREIKSEIIRDVRLEIASAVDPLKDEMVEMKNEIAEAKKRVADLEAKANKSNASSKDNSNSSFALQKMMDKMDPAKKRIAFIGFPENVQEDARIQKIEEFIKLHAPSYRIVDAGCFHSGPYNNQKLTRVSYAEFGSQDTARKVLDRLNKSELTVNGASIGIKAARTKLNGTRNYSLRSAEEKIKASDAKGGAEVILDWKERVIKVGTKIAFKQEKADITGSFLDPFSSLTLP